MEAPRSIKLVNVYQPFPIEVDIMFCMVLAQAKQPSPIMSVAKHDFKFGNCPRFYNSRLYRPYQAKNPQSNPP
jgi:hypothetical protein